MPYPVYSPAAGEGKDRQNVKEKEKKDNPVFNVSSISSMLRAAEIEHPNFSLKFGQ